MRGGGPGLAGTVACALLAGCTIVPPGELTAADLTIEVEVHERGPEAPLRPGDPAVPQGLLARDLPPCQPATSCRAQLWVMRWQTPDEAPDDPIGRFSLFFDTPIGFGWAADARPPTQFSRGSDPADRDLAEEHEALRRWRSHPAPGGGFTSGPGDLLWSLDATSSGELALVHWEDVEDVPQLPTPQVVAVGYAVVGEARWVVELACQEGSGGPAEPILRCDTPDPGSGSSGAMSAGRGHIARSLPGGRAVVNVSPWRAASGRGT